MPSPHHLPPSCHWFPRLASALDPRSAPRLAWLLVGAVLARGRQTVTSWIRAAGLSDEYRPCYTTVTAAGERTDRIAARLAHDVVKPLVTGADRLVFALDDTPTGRYGRHVQGAGVHHNPTPGPANSSYVYGHVWVVLGLLAAHPAWLAGGGGKLTREGGTIVRRSGVESVKLPSVGDDPAQLFHRRKRTATRWVLAQCACWSVAGSAEFGIGDASWDRGCGALDGKSICRRGPTGRRSPGGRPAASGRPHP